MIEDEFIETSVAHQIGAVPAGGFVEDESNRDFTIAASNGSLLWWEQEKAAPNSVSNWYMDGEKIRADYSNLLNQSRYVNREKAVVTLAEIQAAGADFDVFIDMQDRRVRNLVSESGTVQPVFSFNRLDDSAGRVLWPLPKYHDIEAPDFLGTLNPNRIPWAQKRNQVAWRGIVGGRANPKGDVRRERTRLKPLLKKVASGEVTMRQAKRVLGSFPRHRFVETYYKNADCDVGFVDGNRFLLKQEPLLAHLEKARIQRPDFQEFKYLAVLRGLDVGSSFYWTMNSGSLGLVMETPFSSFASCHFKPWEHYVPFREDLSDFDERLSWCRENQDECQAMVHAASEMCKLLGRSDLRQTISKGVIRKYQDNLQRC